MSKPNPANRMLEALNKLLLEKADSIQIIAAHNVLLKWLQGDKREAPEWGLYPVARDFFTQHDPLVYSR